MSRILLTSGPTRQFLDPVRYLSNASSGRMGAALAHSLIQSGHEVTIVSGPVRVEYPSAASVIDVVTTADMLAAAVDHFQRCDGAIGAAAPCDYQPRQIESDKWTKDGGVRTIELVETEDVVATLGRRKRSDQWVVGFALETEDLRFRAIVKLEKKHCDLIVTNDASAIDSETNQIEILDRHGRVVMACQGTKTQVAERIVQTIDTHLIQP